MIFSPMVFHSAIVLAIYPIYLGIDMIVYMEIGMISAQVGLELFMVYAVAGMSIMAILRTALPFLIVLFVFLIRLTLIL